MADDDPEVTEWQAWRKKVDAALATLTRSREDDPEKKKDGEAGKTEDVIPPKKDAQPPKDKEEAPPPKPVRGPLHKLIFG